MTKLFILLILISACASPKQDKRWKKFESKEGGFLLLHPDFKVINSKSSFKREGYGVISINKYEIKTNKELDSNIKYVIRWLFFHESNEELGIYAFTRDYRNENERLVKETAKQLNGTVDSLTQINKNGVELCEAKISLRGKPDIVFIQTFIKGNKQYVLEVLKDKNNFKNSSIHKFFNSFQFIPQKPKKVKGLVLKIKDEPIIYKPGELLRAKVFFGKSDYYDSLNVKPIMRFKHGRYTKFSDYNYLITTIGDTGYVNFIVRDDSIKIGEERIKNWSVLVTLPLPKRDTSFIYTGSYVITK